MPVTVALAPNEIVVASTAGALLHAFAKLQGLKDAYGKVDEGLHAHIRGACGEVVVAKHFNVYWSALTGFGVFDAAFAWEVRTAGPQREHGRPPRLIVHKNAKPEAPYIFVEETTYSDTTFLIHGWCYGREAFNEDWWDDPTHRERWAYFVPREFLRPLDTLPHPVAERVVYNLAG